jgi:aminomethyltransferase
MAEAAAAATLRETPLAAVHRALGARMVPFAGYQMPVQYPTGIIAEHLWTRAHAGLFDVSHMGPCFLALNDRGSDADANHRAIAAIAETLVSGDIAGLSRGQLRYTLLMNESGGVNDDLMIGRPADPAWSGVLYIIVNADGKEADFDRFQAAADAAAKLNRGDDNALLALQGPEAEAVLAPLLPGVTDLSFMTYASFAWHDSKLVVSRSGYTGEDGFEILVPPGLAETFCKELLADARVKPIGLGARDSLRLEAGLPLYGHDLDETTSPIEADLGFAVAKRRRLGGGFPGAQRVRRELAEGPGRRRVGLTLDGKAPVRAGAEIRDVSGRRIGIVTSGGYGATVGGPIAMGYVEAAFATPGAKVGIEARGKALPATVTELPFVPHRYVRKPRASS